MLTSRATAALLGAGATAAYLAGEAFPARRMALRILALALAGAAVYAAWRATVARGAGSGGVLGLLGDLAIGENVQEGAAGAGVPSIGGLEVGPGRVTLPDGTVLDGITGDVLQLAPVSGSIVSPAEGGRPARGLGHSDYAIVVELRNNTGTTLRSPLTATVSEDRTWPLTNVVLTFATSPVELEPGATVRVTIPAETGSLILGTVDATATVRYGGFVLGTVRYSIV